MGARIVWSKHSHVARSSQLLDWQCFNILVIQKHAVSRSSTESEYCALANLGAELLWIRSLLREVGFLVDSPSILWCDNISAQAPASNPVLHFRSKHIELDIHFIWDKLLAKELEVRYVLILDQTANCFTKPLSYTQFRYLRDKLGVQSFSYSSLRGMINSHQAKSNISAKAHHDRP